MLCCQGFGQVKPNLAFQGQMIPYDESLTLVPTPLEKEAIQKPILDAIESAQSKQINDIGRINLAQLKDQIKQVHIVIVKPGARAVGSGQFTVRVGSVYVPSTKTVYVNSETLVANPDSGIKILPHEFLGALGFDDEKYEISTVLMSKNSKLAADALKKRNLDLSKSSIRSQTKDMVNRSSSGGVTVIGGGGDEVLFSAKVYMLDQYPVWKDWFVNRYLKESDFFQEALKKGVDLRSTLNDELMDDYLVYFTGIGFEHMPPHLRQTDAALQNPNELEKIMNVYTNEFSDGFIRMSREHWNLPIAKMSLEQSRFLMSMAMHTTLFDNYILKRYRK